MNYYFHDNYVVITNILNVLHDNIQNILLFCFLKLSLNIILASNIHNITLHFQSFLSLFYISVILTIIMISLYFHINLL
jgi:hypothetical protein